MARTGDTTHCNNPKGKNQYPHCPSNDDPRIAGLLRGYHRQGISDRKELSKLLKNDHGIIMSESTISRRKRELGLRASGLTTQSLPDAVKRQLVLDQMAKDPEGKIGAITVKARIFKDTGIDITRDWIRNEMRVLAPDEFASRRPRHKNSPMPSHGTFSSPTVVLDQSPSRTSTTVPATASTTCTPRTIRQPRQNTPPCPGPSSHPPPPLGDYPHDDDDDDDNDLFPAYSPPSSYPPPSPTNSNADLPSRPLHQPGTQTSNPHRPGPPSSAVPDSNPMPIAALLDILTRTTPQLVSLTQSLNGVDLRGVRPTDSNSAEAYDGVMKCMEAAALLERQLSRVATGLRLAVPGR